MDVAAGQARVELGEGIQATCRMDQSSKSPEIAGSETSLPRTAKPDLSSLGSMLQARWKGKSPASGQEAEPLSEGQVRSFKIKKLDAEAKKIEVELA